MSSWNEPKKGDIRDYWILDAKSKTFLKKQFLLDLGAKLHFRNGRKFWRINNIQHNGHIYFDIKRMGLDLKIVDR